MRDISPWARNAVIHARILAFTLLVVCVVLLALSIADRAGLRVGKDVLEAVTGHPASSGDILALFAISAASGLLALWMTIILRVIGKHAD